LKLRQVEPELRGAFRVPLRIPGLAVLAALPILLMVVAVVLEIRSHEIGLPGVIAAVALALGGPGRSGMAPHETGLSQHDASEAHERRRHPGLAPAHVSHVVGWKRESTHGSGGADHEAVDELEKHPFLVQSPGSLVEEPATQMSRLATSGGCRSVTHRDESDGTMKGALWERCCEASAR